MAHGRRIGNGTRDSQVLSAVEEDGRCERTLERVFVVEHVVTGDWWTRQQLLKFGDCRCPLQTSGAHGSSRLDQTGEAEPFRCVFG
ncbi:MAG: hypothetical protein OXH63_23085 [Gemmatimonadetes bacterium]|nr:hypothetical protein [Gemmatimonadota bacterium]